MSRTLNEMEVAAELPLLYGMGPSSGEDGRRYRRELAAWLVEHDWIAHSNQSRFCWDMLRVPMHKRGGPGCRRSELVRGGEDGGWIDHPVLLRRGPAKWPTQWALLSQLYAGPREGERVMVEGIRGRDVGLAPYGRGTRALLFEGATR